MFKHLSTQIILGASALAFPYTVHAQASGATKIGIDNLLNKASEKSFGATTATVRTPGEVVGSLVQVVLGFTGTVTFIIFLYGGFLWLTARGNDQQVESAKKYLRNGVIGTILVIAAFSISIFLTNVVFKATV
jgi:hypothetical protein